MGSTTGYRGLWLPAGHLLSFVCFPGRHLVLRKRLTVQMAGLFASSPPCCLPVSFQTLHNLPNSSSSGRHHRRWFAGGGARSGWTRIGVRTGCLDIKAGREGV